MGAVGTVTYADGSTVYAFGHELDGAGRRSLLLQDAYVYYVINNPDPLLQPSYKLASPGHTLGTITSDTPNAVIGQVGSPPPTTPVDVTVHDLDTHKALTLDTQVADETNVGALENRRIGIVIDRDDRTGPLQPNRMIRCAADTDCEIESRLDRLAGEPDLQLPRHPALVRHAACRA